MTYGLRLRKEMPNRMDTKEETNMWYEEHIFTFRGRKVYKRVRVAFRSGEVDVVEVGLSFYRFSLI